MGALGRELHEELGIRVQRARLVCSHDHIYRDGPRVSLRFYSVEFTGEPENRVFEQIHWCRLADLARLDFLDGDRPIIAKLMEEGIALLGHDRS